jgi:hypothetical protein
MLKCRVSEKTVVVTEEEGLLKRCQNAMTNAESQGDPASLYTLLTLPVKICLCIAQDKY